MFEKRLKEIQTRRAEIRTLLAGDDPLTDKQLDDLEKEARALETEEAGLTRRASIAKGMNGGANSGGGGPEIPGPANPIIGRGGVGVRETGDGPRGAIDSRAAHLADLQGIRLDDVEERAKRFVTEQRMTITTDAVKRSLTLSSGNIAQPTRVSGINPAPTEVSAIVDMVHVVDAEGQGGDGVAYDVPDAMKADMKKDDGTATEDSLKGPRVAEITPTLITTLGYVSKRIQRTTPLNYQARTSDTALRALRKKVGRLIVAGDPTAAEPEITGILKAAAIQDGSDLHINKIDATTLRKIALSYGGDDAIEGGGVLLLNKKDLIAFGDIRGTNEKKAVYEFVFDEGSTTTGIIKEGGLAVRFCIDNALPALSDPATVAEEYCMCYGKPLAYQLDLFGPYTVEVSKDYKFAEGLLAVMGEAMVGGNVISYNGFLRVKKSAGA